MNMISTGAFLNEMDASDKQQTLAERFAAVWEKKNAKAARAGGVSLMALSLAACGSSSDDDGDDGGEVSTPVQSSSLTVSADNFSTTAATITAARDYTPGGNDLVNSLQTDDVITGSASVAQEMVITFGNNNDAGAATVAPTISNVETITFNNVSSNGAVDTLDMGKVTGATAVNVTSLDDNTVIRGMDNSGIALKASSVSDESSDVAFEFDTDATGMAGTATNVSLAIDGFLGDAIAVGAGATTTDAGVEVAGTGVDKITMTSSGDASVVNSIASTNVTEFDITATADTTITGVTATGVTTVGMASSAGVTTSIDVALNANANAAFHYTGGAGDDTLRIDTNFQGGAVEAADDLRGGDGDDTLRVDVLGAGTTVGALDENSAAVVQGFENIHLAIAAGAGTTTTDMDFFSGATSIDLTAAVVGNTFQVNDITDAQAGDIDVTVSAAGAGATTINADLKDGFGTAETLDLDLTLAADAQTLTINDDNNNIESLNLSINSFSTTISEDTGSFETSYTITGGGAGETLAFGAAISSTTVDFGGVASDITMTAGGTTQTITTGSGDDDVTNNAGAKTVSLGAGADRFTTGDSLGTTGTNIDSIDGGDGTDILEFTADMTNTAAALGAVSNFEVLDINSAAAESINMSNFINNSGFTRIDFGDGGGNTLTVTNASSTLNDIRLNVGAAGDTPTFSRLVDSAEDTLTISVRGDLDNAGGGTDMGGFSAVDEETINISGSSAANDVDFTSFTATDMTTLNISGAADVDTGTISSTGLTTIDTSAASGALNLLATNATTAITYTGNANTGGAVTITTGSGDDTITGGAGIDTITGGAGTDTISGLGGADEITGGDGADTLTGGAGLDSFIYAAGTVATQGADTITDFTASQGDEISIDIAVAGGAAGTADGLVLVDANGEAANAITNADLVVIEDGIVIDVSGAAAADLAAINSALSDGGDDEVVADAEFIVILNADTNGDGGADAIQAWYMHETGGAAGQADDAQLIATLSNLSGTADLTAVFTATNVEFF